MPLQQLPVQGLDDINHQRRHREVTNKILTHQFDDSRVRTSAEISAGVTPINYAWPILHAFRYMTDAQRVSVLAQDLVEDVTTPLVNLLLVLAQASSGYAGFLPAGKYKHTQNLTVPASRTIQGINFQSTLAPTNAVTKALIQTSGSTIDGIAIDGTATTNAHGLSIGDEGSAVNNGFTRNVYIYSFTGSSGIGLYYNQGIGWRGDNIYLDSNFDGMVVGGAVASFPTNSDFHKVIAKNNLRRGLSIFSGYSLVFVGADLELNQEAGLLINQTIGISDFVDDINFINLWCEQNWQSLASGAVRHAQFDAVVSASNRVAFRNPYFSSSVGTPRSINFAGAATGCVLDNPYTGPGVPGGMFLADVNSSGIVVNWPETIGVIDSMFVDNSVDGWQFLYEARAAFTPSLTFATPGNLSVAYSTRVGRVVREGHQITIAVQIQTSTFTHTTASGALRITGLPFTVKNTSGADWIGQLIWSGITKATYTSIGARAQANGTIVDFVASGSGVGAAAVTAADTPTGGTILLELTIVYEM